MKQQIEVVETGTLGKEDWKYSVIQDENKDKYVLLSQSYIEQLIKDQKKYIELCEAIENTDNSLKKLLGDNLIPNKITRGVKTLRTLTKGWRKIRYKVLQRDNFKCQYCGRTPQDDIKLEVDHIYPISRGGTSGMANLKTACKDCNIGKSDSILY